MADLDQILDALAGRLGPREGEPEPLEGGITNHNFQVRFGTEDYVLRLHGKDTELLGIDRSAERMASEAAARLGFAPPVAGWGEDHLLTGFLAALPVDVDAVRADPAPVGRVLRAFHGCELKLPVRFWVPELMDRHAEIALRRGAKLPDAYAPSTALARRIGTVLPPRHLVPSHNDLLPGNLLRVPSGGAQVKIMLVDWEYAGMNHPMFDLGNLSVNHEFDEQADEVLLATYLDREPEPSQRAALALMRIMSDAREAAWGVVQGVTSALEFDFAAYAAKHFARLQAAAADPRLEGWFDAARA